MKRRVSRAVAERLESRRLLSHPAFVSGGYYPIDADPASFATADFNADGKADLCVANAVDNTVGVLLNNGDGTFAPKVDYMIGHAPASLTAADLNGDSKLDLAVVFENASLPYANAYVRVLLNNGDGTLASGGEFNAGDGLPASQYYVPPSSITAADFNDDGRVDLAVGTFAGSEGAVNVLLNNGDATFASYFPYYMPFNPAAVMSADLNGDNRVDLAALDPSYKGGVRILLNNGDGRFTPTADYFVGTQPRSMAIADFNNDGAPDLVISGDGSVNVLLNNANGSFAPATYYTTSAVKAQLGYSVHYTRIVAADFSGDGAIDIAAVSLVGSYFNPFTLLLNNGNGVFGVPIEYNGPSAYSIMASADFNGDGRMDLAWASRSGYPLARVGVLLNAGNSLFAVRTDYLNASTRPHFVFDTDVNRDGSVDLILGSTTVGAQVFLNNGDGTFTPAGHIGFSETVLAVVDLNGDGYPDAVSAESGFPGTTVLGVRLNNGDGTFGPLIKYMPGPDYNSNFYVVAEDFGSDGSRDLAIGVPGGNTFVLLNNGDGTFVSSGQYTGSGKMSVADFDGDGVIDLAISTKTAMKIMIGNGNGTFAAGWEYLAGPGSITSADFNGDTKLDIVLNNDSGRFIFVNNGSGTFTVGVQQTYAFPPSVKDIVAADFNGDGKSDLAFIGGILLNKGDGTFAAATGFATGARPEGLIAADLNGDGKPDLAWANKYSNSMSVMLNAAPPTIQWASFEYAAQPRILYRFFGNAPAGVSIASLVVSTVPGNHPVSVIDYTYDPVKRIASFTLDAPLPDGNYHATLTVAGHPSLSHTFDFFVLAGDANQDRVVDMRDLMILAANWGQSNKAWCDADFNCDGVVNAADLGILATHWQDRLEPPPPPPQPLAVTTRLRSPSRQPTRVLME